MKTKDILTIATTALGTATLTVAFLASPTTSGTDANSQAVTIAKPKLVANGIEMMLSAAEGRQFKAGDQPAFELCAVNTLEPALRSGDLCDHVRFYGGQSDVADEARFRLSCGARRWHWRSDPTKPKCSPSPPERICPRRALISVSLSQVGQVGKGTAASNPGIASTTALRPGGHRVSSR